MKISAVPDIPLTEEYWYTLVNKDNVRFMVIFNFKPEMYKVFRRYNPRNTASYIVKES